MKKLFYSIVLLSLSSSLLGQVYFEEEEADSLQFKDRLFFGGNFSANLGFGGGSSFVDISPLVGYMVNTDFSVGVGATYLYVSREFIILPGNDRFRVSNSVYGGRAFLRHTVIENYFAHGEVETLNTEVPLNDGSNRTTREWVPGVFIEGGTFQPIFARGGVNITVLYNLAYDSIRSPYGSAWVFRFGVTF